jgi:hypothetical protein
MDRRLPVWPGLLAALVQRGTGVAIPARAMTRVGDGEPGALMFATVAVSGVASVGVVLGLARWQRVGLVQLGWRPRRGA